MKNKFLILLLPLLMTACGGSTPEASSSLAPTTGLKGKFLNSIERNPYLLRSAAETEQSRQFPDVDFMYCTTYPIRNITGWGVFESIYAISPDLITSRTYSFQYRYDQALTVLKDNTYHYVYTIAYSPNSQDSVSGFITVDVDIYGTYTYTKIADNEYAVSLSVPLTGTETITAGHYNSNSLDWFAGNGAYKHSEPDKVVNFEELRAINKEEFDWYVRSRVVTIEVSPESASDNKVYDDLFNRYFLDDFGPYCTYN